MKFRKALMLSTNFGLCLFVLMIIGIVLWTTDTMLGWNILPDVFDMYAETLVMIVAILAISSVVMSMMCSLSVIAESAATKAGMPDASFSPGQKRKVLIGLGCVVLVMFILYQIDAYRSAQFEKEDIANREQTHIQQRAAFRSAAPEALLMITDDLKSHFVAEPTDEGDKAIERFLLAMANSFDHQPKASILVKAKPPYAYTQMYLADKQTRQYYPDRPSFLRSDYTGFSQPWEQRAVEAAFGGGKMTVPEGRWGAFFNTEVPSGWGLVRQDGEVIAILMLEGRRQIPTGYNWGSFRKRLEGK